MKLTDLTEQVRKELESLESSQRSLSETVASLIQRQRLLESDILKKEEYLARIQEKAEATNKALSEYLSRISSLEEMIAEKSRVAEAQTAKKIKVMTEESTWEAQEKMKQAQVRESQLEDRQAAVMVKLQDLDERRKSQQDELADLEERMASFEESVRARIASVSEQEEKARQKILALDIRDKESAHESGRLSLLKSELLKRENAIRKSEEAIMLTRQSTETAQKRAIGLSESLERKLSGLEDKEKSLRVREIRLADREGIASGHS